MRTPFCVLQAPGLVIASAALLFTGCPPQPSSTGPSTPSAEETPAQPVSTDSTASAAPQPQIAEPPPKPTMPKVVMTEAQAATCLKQVGDQLPEAMLKTLDGQEQSLASALGKTLSVVLFWSSDDADFATFLLEDMTADVVKPHGERGVQLVAINVRGAEGDIQKVKDRAKAEFPILRDENGTLFEQLATEKLPRIYLVDAQGKILWFDIEYSRTTRRQLDQAIQVTLGDKLAAATSPPGP
jgi:peroxiredoxin